MFRKWAEETGGEREKGMLENYENGDSRVIEGEEVRRDFFFKRMSV